MKTIILIVAIAAWGWASQPVDFLIGDQLVRVNCQMMIVEDNRTTYKNCVGTNNTGEVIEGDVVKLHETIFIPKETK